jgi:hypothetical protein
MAVYEPMVLETHGITYDEAQVHSLREIIMHVRENDVCKPTHPIKPNLCEYDA